MQPQKLAPTTEVGCGLQKYSTFSEKRAKTLIIFFFIFLNFSLIFPKGTSRNQTFLFFYIFSKHGLKKDATTKIGTYN
jgi:hypothetical protein